MTTKFWIRILAAIFAVSLWLGVVLLMPGEAAEAVNIYADGKLVKTVSLKRDQEFTVESQNGTNVITIRDGKIAVTEADCPDHYCMQRGFCDGGTAIVCLPNRLVIEFAGEQEIDGVVG